MSMTEQVSYLTLEVISTIEEYSKARIITLFCQTRAKGVITAQGI